ncbi:RNA methyltransferase [Rudanella paleaurantiibacter]|uniref:RNA methyltransferase n=1 Tax=Rudanella paleaurantiibacter TaxID=2614655 RepID=A0A7J5TRV1_9BACT|nr:RNA methyltransferase [Rudanella paleaurantiibacter]KAB7725393.1 RNA methyltransferase [Rudanella paleaurantiibacter]
MIQLPPAFRAQMQAQLADEFSAFEAALAQEPPVSIRVNPRKPTLNTAHLKPVPWCADGYYLPERPVFTLDPLFQAGAYYVQEASSMLLAEALRQSVNLNRPLKVLDLCAAPGGKTTLMASLLSDDSLLMCNEVIRTRIPILRENVEKWGYPNVVISNHDPDDMGGLAGFFDVVMVDAPCSGEGLFRKDADAVQEWSTDAVQLCSARQKRILAAAAPLVDQGGILIYSTCTYNEAENTENMQFLLQNGFKSRPLDLPADWQVVAKQQAGAVGYQCYPHRVEGEGFFISVFEKTDFAPAIKNNSRPFRDWKPLRPRETAQVRSWLAEPDRFSYWQKPNGDVIAILTSLEKTLYFVNDQLRNKGFGLDLGTFKGTDFVPAHALALSTALAPTIPGVELSKEEALRYFKKENLVLNEPVRGWVLARFEGLALGWMKGVGNRVNNYLPKDWRIRMEIKEYV